MKKFALLLMADAAAGNGPAAPVKETPEQIIARLTAENQALADQVAAFEAKETERAAEEKQIAEKVAAGLTRDQAIAVIKRQKDHDAAVAALWEKRRPAIVAVLKERLTERETRARIREIDGSITLDEINAAKASLK
jgi:hypothetical protein